MKDHKRSFVAAALVMVCAAISTVLASSATGVPVVEAIRSVFIDPFSFQAQPTSTQTITLSTSSLSSFHFLEPLAPGGGNPQEFDPSLLDHLTVEVCQVAANGCQVVRTFTSQSPSSERLRIGRTGNRQTHYIVNWDTLSSQLPNQNTYRISVTVADLQLGSIDIPPDRHASLGRTWPIKFLIERDPVIRVRLLRYLGRSASQVANALRTEFNLCGQESAALLAGDLEPFPQTEIDLAIRGVCQNAIIPDTTKVADEETRNALTAYDPATGQMTFSSATALLRTLDTGDVLASEPGPAAPYGYLRKVTSIRNSQGGIVLGTVQAKLNEAISQGTLDASGVLSPVGSSRLRRGTTANATSEKRRTSVNGVEAIDEGDGFTFQRDIDVTFELSSGRPGGETSSGSGTVRVQGSVYFNAAYNVGVGVEACATPPFACVDRFEAWAGLEQKSKLRVTGDFEGHLEEEEEIFDVPLDPIVFFIGPVPVVIVPKVEILVGANGDAHVDFSFEAKATSRFKVGAKWTDPDDGGHDWENISEFAPLEDEFIDADFNGDMRVEGYAKLDASLLLYNVAGPGMDGSLGIGGDVQTGRRPYWTVFGHVITNVNFEVDIGGIVDLGGWSARVLDEDFEIAAAANQPPEFFNVRFGRIPVDVGELVYLGPRTPGSLQGFYELRDLDGDAPELSIQSNIEGPLTGLSHRFTTPGLRTITITATDAEGESASITLAIDVRNAAPILTVTPLTGAVAAGDQFFVTATAYDPEDGFLPCSRISWSVVSPDVKTVSTNPLSCRVVVIFNQQGNRTVRATATDSFGVSFTGEVTVAVGPPPGNFAPRIDLDSWKVFAERGPRTADCPIGILCLVPDNPPSLLFNGRAGDYHPPLSFEIDVVDPEGDPFVVEFVCQTGSVFAPITVNSEGEQLCVPEYSPTEPILVYVNIYTPIILGGEGRRLLATGPISTYAMLQRTN